MRLGPQQRIGLLQLGLDRRTLGHGRTRELAAQLPPLFLAFAVPADGTRSQRRTHMCKGTTDGLMAAFGRQLSAATCQPSVSC